MSLANISIVGNLVKPPEQMHFSSGKVKTTLLVAVNAYGRPNRGGDSADFYKVETWGKLAELANQYLVKGNQVAVSGRLLFDRWTDKQGKNRFMPIVEVAQISLPPRSKGLDSTGERTSSLDQQIKGVITGNMSCSDEEDPLAISDADVAASEPFSDLLDDGDSDKELRNEEKLLKVCST